MDLKRGDIHFINFPYTFDKKYPNGKPKFVLVLQGGIQFRNYDTVEVLLITTNKNSVNYGTTVEIEIGTTILEKTSWVSCAQPYPVEKSLFYKSGAWCAGQLPEEKMLEVDTKLYEGLCMKLEEELGKEDAFAESFATFIVGTAIGALVNNVYTKHRQHKEQMMLTDKRINADRSPEE